MNLTSNIRDLVTVQDLVSMSPNILLQFFSLVFVLRLQKVNTDSQVKDDAFFQ